MASEQVWVVAACFNEEAVITRFIERVLVVPGVDHLVSVSYTHLTLPTKRIV